MWIFLPSRVSETNFAVAQIFGWTFPGPDRVDNCLRASPRRLRLQVLTLRHLLNSFLVGCRNLYNFPGHSYSPVLIDKKENQPDFLLGYQLIAYWFSLVYV